MSPMEYCHGCEWAVSAAEGYTKGERSRMAIDHFVETGHAIDTTDSEIPSISPPAHERILRYSLLH